MKPQEMKKTYLIFIFITFFPLANFAQQLDNTSVISQMHNYVKFDLGMDEFTKIHPNLKVLNITVNTRADVVFYDGLSPHVRNFLSLHFEGFTYVDKYGRQIVSKISEIADPSRFSASFKVEYYLDTRFGKTPTSWTIHGGSHGKEDSGRIISLGDVWYASKEDLKGKGKENPSDKEIFNNLRASVNIAGFSNGSINPEGQIRRFIEEKLKEQENIEKQQDLLSRADQTTDKEEKIALLKEAKKYADSQAKAEEIDQKIGSLQQEIDKEKEERGQGQVASTEKSAAGQGNAGEEGRYVSGNDAENTQGTYSSNPQSGKSNEQLQKEYEANREAQRRLLQGDTEGAIQAYKNAGMHTQAALVPLSGALAEALENSEWKASYVAVMGGLAMSAHKDAPAGYGAYSASLTFQGKGSFFAGELGVKYADNFYYTGLGPTFGLGFGLGSDNTGILFLGGLDAYLLKLSSTEAYQYEDGDNGQFGVPYNLSATVYHGVAEGGLGLVLRFTHYFGDGLLSANEALGLILPNPYPSSHVTFGLAF